MSAKSALTLVEHKALRLHVKLRLAGLQPTSAIVTTGKTCERVVLRASDQAVVSHECDELSAEDIMEIYRHHWQVEMFFPLAQMPGALLSLDLL